MRDIISKGRERSHDIAFTTIRPRRNAYHENADLVFFTDVFNFPQTLKSLGNIRRFSSRFLYDAAIKNKFIHFNNAYTDICNLPHLPCSGKSDDICLYKSPWFLRRNLAIRDFSRKCHKEHAIVRHLFKESVLNIFLSPLHARTIYNVLGLKAEKHSYYIMKPTINGLVFNDQGKERDIDYLFVGLIGEAKGLENIRRRFKNENIWFIGNIAPGERLDFGTYVGFVPYDKLPEYMNRAKNFVFLPRWPEPQGRVVVEAALCGCNIISNQNVGALSFDFNIRNHENYQNACDEFWERIENLKL